MFDRVLVEAMKNLQQLLEEDKKQRKNRKSRHSLKGRLLGKVLKL